MDGSVGILVCYLFAIAPWATVEGLSATVTPDTKQRLIPGQAPLDIACELDVGAVFMMKGKLNWFHKAADNTEIQITEQGNVIEETNYKLSFTFDPVMKSALTILSVGDAQNGQYICRVVAEEGSPPLEEAVEIEILYDIGKMELQINDHLVTTVMETEIYEREFEAKKSSLTCTSYGSSSYPELRMLMDGKDLKPDQQLNIQDETEPRATPSYKSSITTHLKLMPTHKMLKCEATTADFDLVEVGVGIHIITLVPLITCTNKSATNNDRYVQLECDVSSEKPIKQMYFEMGHNSHIEKFYPGNKTEDLTEVREQGEGNNRKVLLEIYKAERRHFDSIFYLIVEASDGSIFKEPIYLREIGGSGNVSKCNLLLLISCVIGVLTRWTL